MSAAGLEREATSSINKLVELVRPAGSSRIRYLDIVNNIIEAVEKGTLLPGERLPPQRVLAHRLNLAVGTVTRAYSEAERRGLVIAEVGRGTYIAPPAAPRGLATNSSGQETVDFTHNRVPIDGYVGEFCRTLAYIAKRPNVAAMLDYPPNAGDVRFRSVASDWLSRTGVSVPPDRLIVCNGVQHGLSVILGALSKPGDLVVAEQLNYPGIRLLQGTYHLRLEGVAMDGDGMVPEALEEICRRERPKFIFCQPTVHNPTAALMPPERRRKIAALIERYDMILLEDDIYGFLPEVPTAPIASLIPDRSYYVTGTSKTIGSGIRVGYIAAPARTVHAIMDMVHATTWIPAPFMVEVASTWMMDGTANRIIESHRQSAKQRQAIVAEVLAEFQYACHEAAFHIWLALPKPWRHDEFAEECRARNIAVNATENFVVGQGSVPPSVRICLGGFRSLERLASGLEELRDVLNSTPRPRAFIV